jgi:putative endonuclease
MADKHYFYVLKTADNTFYGGYTTNPVKRLKEHNDGVGAKYTRLKSRRPVEMIHLEVFETRSEATKAEYQFKQLKRTMKVRYLGENEVKSVDLLKKFFLDTL